MGSLVGLDKVFSIETPQSWPAEPADINFHVLHVFGDFEPRQKVNCFENVGFPAQRETGIWKKPTPCDIVRVEPRWRTGYVWPASGGFGVMALKLGIWSLSYFRMRPSRGRVRPFVYSCESERNQHVEVGRNQLIQHIPGDLGRRIVT